VQQDVLIVPKLTMQTRIFFPKPQFNEVYMTCT